MLCPPPVSRRVSYILTTVAHRRLVARLNHPARLIPAAFLAGIALGTVLLMLPISHVDGTSAPPLTALFTATSALCVTGLIVVDTASYWSGFGQAVIMVLFQIGGFGIMTGATLLSMLVTRRLALGQRLLAQAETKSMALGDVPSVLRLIIVVTLAVELTVAALLAYQLHEVYGEPWATASWNGIFQSISAFNNAGFSTYSDNLVGFATDPIILVPLMLAVVLGGIGFPVLFELRSRIWYPSRWSLHTRLTVYGTFALLMGGAALTALYEWANPATLGAFEDGAKVLNAFFHSVMSRTAGFNTINIGDMSSESLIITDALMLIGGGSAGTAGGIKITTFLLLGFIVWAEIRGRHDVNVFHRRIGRQTQRQALTVVLLSIGAVSLGTLIILSVTDLPLEPVLFETISAFATVGLSTGITADLPPVGQLVLIVLMFIGRVGTITIASALALSDRYTAYRLPEERPIVG
jgi:trk system potassium uptake protein TrkH